MITVNDSIVTISPRMTITKDALMTKLIIEYNFA